MVSQKVKSLHNLRQILKRLRKANNKIVFTNGCFDILHPGHIKYLEKAKSLGDVLVVGLNSDGSVRKLKGNRRPILSQKSRAILLQALGCVDYICIFSSLTPLRLIKAIRPDVLVKGGDWKVKDIVGADFVRSYGGVVKNVPYIKGFSTRRIIEKLGG